MTDSTTKPVQQDSDAHKGAAESEAPQSRSSSNPNRPDIHGNLSGQLPHRDEGQLSEDLNEDNGTDFPEPGSSPEHSGEKSA